LTPDLIQPLLLERLATEVRRSLER